MTRTIQNMIILFLLTFISSVLFGQSTNMYKSVKIDTTRKVTSDEVVRIARRFLNRSYKNTFDLREKSFIDQNLKKLEADGLRKADRMAIAEGLSSTAVFFTGTGESQNIPVVFSARAVIEFPEDTLIVNNFGAVLRMMDSVSISVPVLLYAKSLYPDAPVILTNLGNSLFELYDDKTAEYFYKRALLINPDFALARHGLVSVYLKQRNLQKAIEELFKGAKGIYSQSLNDAQNKLKNKPAYSPPGEPISDMPEKSPNNPQATDSPNPNVPIDELRLPEFHDWPDIASMAYDKSIEKNLKKLQEISSGKCLSESPVLKMNTEQMIQWANNQNKPGRILYKANSFGMDLMQQYFYDEIEKIDKKCSESDKTNEDRYKKAIEQMAAEEESAIPANGDVKAYQAFLIKHCKDLTRITDNYFAEWKRISGIRHKAYNDLLMTYWVYCEQYLNRTYDLNEFEILNCRRKMFVASQLMKLYVVYSGYGSILPLINVASFAASTGECPKMPPPQPPAESEEDNVNIPDKNAPPCPFKDKKLEIGLGACTVGIDCESVEGECGEGLIAGAKWNFKKKELTAFGGAGLKADFGAKGFASASAEAKTGFEITFNTKGQVIDAGYKTEVGAKTSLGNFEGGQTLEVKMTAATGIDISRTNELTLSL